jgi:hypothetical protein
VTVHCKPVGWAPLLFDKERFKATALPGLPVADDRLRDTDCASATGLNKKVKKKRKA